MALDLTKLLGPLLIGQLLLTIIYGLTILQTYIYFTKHSSGDPRFVKLTIAAIGILDTVHIAIGYHLTYYYLITAFANIRLLLVPVWSFQAERLMGAPQSVIVQAFFAYYLFEMSKGEYFIPVLLIALTASQLGMDIWWTIIATKQNSVIALLQATRNPGLGGIAIGIAASCLIGIVTLFYMHCFRSDYAKIKSPFDWLISYTLKTCFVISTCLVISLAFLVADPTNLFYYPPYAIATRLYANAMLTTLNNRPSRQSSAAGPGSIAFALSSTGPSSSTSNSHVTDVKDLNGDGTKSIVGPLPTGPQWGSETDLKTDTLIDG